MKINYDNRVLELLDKVSILDLIKHHDEKALKTAFAAKVDDKLVDLDYILNCDCTLTLIDGNSKTGWKTVNYAAGLVCGRALTNLYPNLKVAQVGLADDGYFVDFLIEPTIKHDQLPNIAKEFKKIVKNNVSLKCEWLDKKTIQKFNNSNDFLLERVKNAAEAGCNVYLVDDAFYVFGEYIASQAKFIKEHEILSMAGAYGNDDANNMMLQRIYGTAHFDHDMFEKFMAKLNDRKERDHRKIGKDLEIFTFDNLVGQGLPIGLPNGCVLKHEIQNYILDKEWEYDFIQVETPVLGTEEMYHVSGHGDHYREDMFSPMQMGNESLVLRPMTCPHHIAVYQHRPRSYRELPLRIAEHAVLHRYEASGALTGLERVRTMQLTDSHIFVRPDQIKSEFKRCFKLIQEVLADFHIAIDYYSLSLRDPENKTKYYDDDKMGQHAEQMLKEALDELDIDYKPMIGEAAFYGPKLDIQIRTVLNHEITVSTLQFDFLLPERFDLSYIGSGGEKVRPIILHRGLIGTYERFISVLLEQTKGVLPLGLSPRQIIILPISLEHHLEYARKIQSVFKKYKIRSSIDDREERLNYKIREAQMAKIPYQVVIGDKECEENLITYRTYGSNEQITVDLDQFLNMIHSQIQQKH